VAYLNKQIKGVREREENVDNVLDEKSFRKYLHKRVQIKSQVKAMQKYNKNKLGHMS